MKKTLGSLFAVLAILLVLTSCSNNTVDEKTTTTETTAVAVAANPATTIVTPESNKKSMLQTVRDRGYIVVGVNASNPGFSFLQEDGTYKGFEVDLAKAISVAVFGTPDKLEFRPLTSKERFVALQSGEIDLLIRTATINFTRDNELGLDFTTPYFYD